MKDEYIIINKSKILKRIEELKKEEVLDEQDDTRIFAKINELKQVLSQSTPLIAEIEKAYEAGKLDKELSLSFDNPKGRYFSSLKLDI